MSRSAGCILCNEAGGTLVFSTDAWRLVRVQELGFPAFYRLIWQGHVKEWSDLCGSERAACGEVLAQIELVLRNMLSPAKINLASLGNMVAHLHWHVIARFEWDTHWPAPVWAEPKRALDQLQLQAIEAKLTAVDAALAQAMAQIGAGSGSAL